MRVRPLAVGLLSAGTVAYEILLVRAFAVEHFHHFAYMAIGVAMLGFGTSGTLLALIRPGESTARDGFVWAAALTAVSLVASPTLVHLIPLDPTQLAWNPAQWPALAAIYVLLAIPFGAGALATVLALTLERRRPGRVYGASFVGAGLGAVVALGILWLLFPERALAAPAVLGGMGALAATVDHGQRWRVAAGVLLVGTMTALVRPPWRFELSPYKGLPQVEAFPDARRVGEATSPIGWVTAVDAPAFRHAPGLSLAFRGVFPHQTALFIDGETAGAVTHWEDDPTRALLDWLPSALPYAVQRPERVLVLGAGGGLEAWNAVAHGASRVVAVELHPGVARLARELDGGGDGPQPFEWVVADARSFVSHGDRARFDVVSLGPGGGFGTTVGGVHSLNEDFLHTTEAYVAYLNRLTPRGILAVTSWSTVPPRTALRVILTVGEAVRRVAPANAERAVVVARSWGTVTALAKPSGFSDEGIERLRSWAGRRRFDLDWYPGIEQPISRFNLVDEPTLYRAARAALAGAEATHEFASAYPFAVSPATDARPYPHHHLRTRSLGTFFTAERGDWLPFAEWGYVALLATLVQSGVVAAFLIVLPAALGRRARPGPRGGALLGYFTAIGLAYLSAEIAAIQQLSLLLGHPVYAVTAVLTALLVFSGAGSAVSDRLPQRLATGVGVALGLVLTLYAGVLLAVVHLFQPAALPVRGLVAIAVLAPPAFLMGMPFPLGLRHLAGDATRRVAWAWATNGFASVIAAPLAALIALERGSPAVLLMAAGAYGVAAILSTRASAPRTQMTTAPVDLARRPTCGES